MKLAQCIILDLLKDYDPVPLLPETCNFHFSGVQLLDQDNPTDDPSILYIGTTTQISSFNTEKLKDFCIICIGKKEDVSSYIKNYQANLILISLHRLSPHFKLGWRTAECYPPQTELPVPFLHWRPFLWKKCHDHGQFFLQCHRH